MRNTPGRMVKRRGGAELHRLAVEADRDHPPRADLKGSNLPRLEPGVAVRAARRQRSQESRRGAVVADDQRYHPEAAGVKLVADCPWWPWSCRRGHSRPG